MEANRELANNEEDSEWSAALTVPGVRRAAPTSAGMYSSSMPTAATVPTFSGNTCKVKEAEESDKAKVTSDHARWGSSER